MTKPIHPTALFRFGILGSLVNRDRLHPGELKQAIENLSKKTYQTPDGKVQQYTAKTLERWYYAWQRYGIDGLIPKTRSDVGSQIPADIQEKLIRLKKEKPSRSISRIIELLVIKNSIGKNELSRSSVHRFLAQHRLSKRTLADSTQIERRSFEAKYAGQLWQGDVMHGPYIKSSSGLKKSYLVTWFDDASRLVCHSAFYFSETAVSVEHALKQALLKRGMPKRILLDNGSCYRSHTLTQICARLGIELNYGRPYEPQGKGKIERWHRTVRDSFLDELIAVDNLSLDEINSRWWIWVERYYHCCAHSGLAGKITPIDRWTEDLVKVQPLGKIAADLDSYFYHRIKRKVRKDSTISYEGDFYEVPNGMVGDYIYLVIDPHHEKAKWVESLEYEKISAVFLLDKNANLTRARQRPTPAPTQGDSPESLVEELYEKQGDLLAPKGDE